MRWQGPSSHEFRAAVVAGIEALMATTKLEWTGSDLYRDEAVSLDDNDRVRVIMFLRPLQPLAAEETVVVDALHHLMEPIAIFEPLHHQVFNPRRATEHRRTTLELEYQVRTTRKSSEGRALLAPTAADADAGSAGGAGAGAHAHDRYSNCRHSWRGPRRPRTRPHGSRTMFLGPLGARIGGEAGGGARQTCTREADARTALSADRRAWGHHRQSGWQRSIANGGSAHGSSVCSSLSVPVPGRA